MKSVDSEFGVDSIDVALTQRVGAVVVHGQLNCSYSQPGA